MEQFLAWFETLTFSVRVYYGLALMFFLLSVGFVVAIRVSQSLKSINRLFKKKYQAVIQQEISMIVVQSSIAEIPEAAFYYKLKKLVSLQQKSHYVSQLILDEIVFMKKNLVGESAATLKRAYISLGFLDSSLRKVKSHSWKKVAKGLRELETMEQENALPYFNRFLTHPNYYLRREARLSVAGIASNPVFFLDDFQETLSDWEKLLLFEKLKHRPKKVIPDFSKWYRHSNHSVVTFSVEMTVQFGQVHNADKLASLLKSSDIRMTCLVVDALRRMEAVQCIEMIVKKLKEAKSSKVLIACLKFMGSIGDQSYEQLLQPYILHHNPMVRMEAVYALRVVGSTIDCSSEYDAQLMMSHLTHPLIA